MKNTAILYLLLLPALSIAHASSIPSLDVTVTNGAGKIVYKGKTSANGTFATGNLEPGNYVVEFDSKTKIASGSKFALSAMAGKSNVSSDSVAGEKFVDPGMAMTISVAGNAKISGQIAPAGSLSKQTQVAATTTTGRAKADRPTKIINGKRYVWVRPQTSTLSGGHWVEEGSPEAMQDNNTRVLGNRSTQPTQPSGGMRY